MDNVFEKVKSTVQIADVVERFGVRLDRHGKSLCPFHKEDTPSFSVERSKNIFTCFGCSAHGDAVDFVAKIKGVEPLKAAKALAEMYGISPNDSAHIRKADKRPAAKGTGQQGASQGAKQGIKKYITECMAAVNDTDYFRRRGLTDDTISRFHLGFDLKERCAVIPYSSKLDYYQTRSVEGRIFRKPSAEEAGSEPLYNPAALKANCAVFLTESPICAISIEQCGGRAVSICGVSGGQKILKEIKSKKMKCVFILALDNDDPGRKAQEELANQLFELNAKFIPYNVSGDCKDPNELLIADSARLTKNIVLAVRAAREKYRTDKDSFTAEELFSWPLVPPRWIVENLIYEGLTVMCAPSKFGKSWLVMNLCLAVAEGKDVMAFRTEKNDCLYYSLEDPPFRLRKRLGILLKGKRPPGAINFVTNADKLGEGFLDRVQQELNHNHKIGLVVVDTLQKIRAVSAANKDVYGHDYEEMGLLKKFADKNKIALIVVHHTRKMKDEDDIFNTVLGSGGISATADTTIILSRNKRFAEETKISVTGRDIEEREFMARLDRNTFVWEMCGDAKEVEAQRARSEYENDTVVRTVKALVKQCPYGWTGTASDILKSSFDIFNEPPTDSPDGIGRRIKRWEQKLYYDGIEHKEKRTGKERKHTFFKRNYHSPQYGVFDNSD